MNSLQERIDKILYDHPEHNTDKEQAHLLNLIMEEIKSDEKKKSDDEEIRSKCKDFLFNEISYHFDKLKPHLNRAKDILEIDLFFVERIENDDSSSKDLFISHLQNAVRLLSLCSREFDLVNRILEPLMMHPFTLTPQDLNKFLSEVLPENSAAFPSEIQSIAFRYGSLSTDGPLTEQAILQLMREINDYSDMANGELVRKVECYEKGLLEIRHTLLKLKLSQDMNENVFPRSEKK